MILLGAAPVLYIFVSITGIPHAQQGMSCQLFEVTILKPNPSHPLASPSLPAAAMPSTFKTFAPVGSYHEYLVIL